MHFVAKFHDLGPIIVAFPNVERWQAGWTREASEATMESFQHERRERLEEERVWTEGECVANPFRALFEYWWGYIDRNL